MRIHWWILLLAVVLLLPPIPFSSELQRSILSFRRRATARAVSAARVWQNWVDALRGALGAYLLSEWAITTNPGVPEGEFEVLLATAALLGVALLAQTIRFVRSFELLAPVFFLCGITLVLGGTPQGVFAVAVGWAFAIGGKNLAYQLPAMAVALVAAGYVLGMAMPLLLNCALILLPAGLSLLLRKKLLFAAASAATP